MNFKCLPTSHMLPMLPCLCAFVVGIISITKSLSIPHLFHEISLVLVSNSWGYGLWIYDPPTLSRLLFKPFGLDQLFICPYSTCYLAAVWAWGLFWLVHKDVDHGSTWGFLSLVLLMCFSTPRPSCTVFSNRWPIATFTVSVLFHFTNADNLCWGAIVNAWGIYW